MKRHIYIVPQADIVTPHCHILQGEGADVHWSEEKKDKEIEANQGFWEEEGCQYPNGQPNLWD